MMIDTHCHVYASEMENTDEIIEACAQNDIHLILNGTDPKSNSEVLELAERHENVHAAIGYLYGFADEVTEADISLLDGQLENDNVVAVGEIGLDYYHGKENMDKQKELFERMLVLAEKHGLPVIVHSRKSMQDTLDMLKGHDICGSMHCYQGSAEMAREFTKLGFYIGIGGPITHKKNKKVKNAVRAIETKHMLLETDSPYLAPEEKRGEINTPLNLTYIAGKLAHELDMKKDEVSEITAQNAKRLFRI